MRTSVQRPRVLLSSVFGPFARDDVFGSRAKNPMELYHNQVTRAQGPFSLRLFHRSWGIMMLQRNISAPSTVLDFPTRERFIAEISRDAYDLIGISGIIVNVGKVREMCRLVRLHAPRAKLVVGGHVAAIPGVESMLDADHIVRGEGIRWMREFLGDDPEAPVVHPVLRSGFGFRVMGLSPPGGGSDEAATIIPSVGCPLGCNFCTTSSFFGGKGRSVHFFKTGRELYDLMAQAERELGTSTFFLMDENFLLDRRRALELLDQIRRNQKTWALYIFSSANAIAKFDIRELVELGVSWIWLGLESENNQYAKLKHVDTKTLVRELQSHGIRVLGSTIIGLEHHTPDNVHQEIEHAVSHDTDFHQFMLYTAVPGTPLYAQMAAEGKLYPGTDLADIHGQHEMNFSHALSPRESGRVLERAFQRDFEKNGPSLYRMMRTMLQGFRRYRNDPDPRVRRRVGIDRRNLSGSYPAALWAMEKFLADTNPTVAREIRGLRRELSAEFGPRTRVWTGLAGPPLLFTSWVEGSLFPRGRVREPPTFLEHSTGMKS